MLEDLQTEVVVEGKAEAKTYDKFACFCKDMTNEKTDAISAGDDMVDDLTATIEQDTSDRADLDTEITELNTKIDKLDKAITLAKEKRTAEKTEYDAIFAELTTGLGDLQNAVKALKAGAAGDSEHYGFLAIKSSIKTIRQAAFMADSMGHSPKHQRALAALLQQDPEVPMQDYNFHSEEIVKTIEGLVDDFKAKISEVKIDETKKVSDFDLQMQADTDEKDTAAKDLKDANELKASKMESLAQAGKDLTVTQAQLSDDQAYLKDLTEKCNLKSKEWDQRSQMRQDELTALTTALTIVKGKVAEKTTEKTVRLMEHAANVDRHAVVVDQPESQGAAEDRDS